MRYEAVKVVSSTVGDSDGYMLKVGEGVGESVGDPVGPDVGELVGGPVGENVG